MWDFIFGLTTGIIFLSLLESLIYVSTKSYKAKELAFSRYYKMDTLWLRTGSTDVLKFPYMDKLVSVIVKCDSLRGTNDDVRVYDAYINDVLCATSVKMFDGENCYYTFHIDDQFDEKEVWDILDTAHKKSEEQRKLEKVVKESTKRSVLEENK